MWNMKRLSVTALALVLLLALVPMLSALGVLLPSLAATDDENFFDSTLIDELTPEQAKAYWEVLNGYDDAVRADLVDFDGDGTAELSVVIYGSHEIWSCQEGQTKQVYSYVCSEVWGHGVRDCSFVKAGNKVLLYLYEDVWSYYGSHDETTSIYEFDGSEFPLLYSGEVSFASKALMDYEKYWDIEDEGRFQYTVKENGKTTLSKEINDFNTKNKNPADLKKAYDKFKEYEKYPKFEFPVLYPDNDIAKVEAFKAQLLGKTLDPSLPAWYSLYLSEFSEWSGGDFGFGIKMVNVNGEPIFISTGYGEDEGEGGNSLGYIKDGRVEMENTKYLIDFMKDTQTGEYALYMYENGRFGYSAQLPCTYKISIENNKFEYSPVYTYDWKTMSSYGYGESDRISLDIITDAIDRGIIQERVDEYGNSQVAWNQAYYPDLLNLLEDQLNNSELPLVFNGTLRSSVFINGAYLFEKHHGWNTQPAQRGEHIVGR